MYKVTHNWVPSYLSEQFSSMDTAHEYNVRGNQTNLGIPKPNTNFLEFSLTYSGAVAWNSIPVEVRASENIVIFRLKLTS